MNPNSKGPTHTEFYKGVHDTILCCCTCKQPQAIVVHCASEKDKIRYALELSSFEIAHIRTMAVPLQGSAPLTGELRQIFLKDVTNANVCTLDSRY